MNSINRFAIVVRPNPPFVDWAHSLEDDMDPALKSWTSVYLVEADEDDEPVDVLRRSFTAIFEEQLEGWHRVRDDWPTPRTFDLFQQWFETDVVDLVFDLSEETIEHDE